MADFVSNQEPQIREMLQEIGVESIEELFDSIPKKLRKERPSFDDGLSEYEAFQVLEKLAAKNSFSHYDSYLGAGAYDHYVPALVSAICSKSEFLTAYTPYQAEASQGMLQAIFEFQSVITALTGLDVANASVYDGASACGEALLMALRCNKDRKKILVSSLLHPHYQAVARQYLAAHAVEWVEIPFLPSGALDLTFAEKQLGEDVAGVLVSTPNFLGVVDDFKDLFKKAKEKGALSLVCANPLAFALYASAAELGADLAFGDAQPLGMPLQFGGPYLGYLSCKHAFVRQLPGRLVSETVDTQGRKGFVLTLQAREQHIRREKATSNICTNQALSALACLITILWYGPEGLKKLALTNYQRTQYLKTELQKLPGIKVLDAPSFNEFVVEFKAPIQKVMATFREAGIEPGLPLEKYLPSLKNALLVAVTEKKSKEQLDQYLESAHKIS